MDRYAADRMVKGLARRVGIARRISPHCLRLSFITAALDAGGPLRGDVQEAASHADPRSSMRYNRARGIARPHATTSWRTLLAGASRDPMTGAGDTGRR
jgi:integrase/recombinase XerD